ncbi:MAG: FG-GAP-like repeat-containing protein, partial [Bacteroidales bacterium]|nr:FG-GAP-like repeat-containing protein [Bacteroidales bacterium]
MKHFFTIFLFFTIILLAYRAEAHPHHPHIDTLVHGTRSRPGGERSLRESIVLSSEKHLKIKGLGDYERDSENEELGERVVLRIAAGGTLFIGSFEDSVSGEFRITDQTLLVVEAGARLQVEDGSLLIVENGGTIIIEENAELVFTGDLSVVLEEGATGYIVGDSDIEVPGISGNFIMVGDLNDEHLGIIRPDYYTNSLQGMVSTTPSGALMYQIPIEIPVGIAGVQPQLSIVYNSQNRVSGILGVGFGLSGLSSISRIGKNFYHDNERTGVTLTMNDHFALDGQRLIPLDSNAIIGEHGVFYDTEMASFSEIKSLGHNIMGMGACYLGPKEFQVRAKDGSTLYYGTDDGLNSRVRHRQHWFLQYDSVVSQWFLSRMEDANGNYIEYDYFPSGDRYASQIKEIRYTGNESASLLPYNRIEFIYEDKPLHLQRKLYIVAFAIADEKLLSEIVCYSENDVEEKRYTFHYTDDSMRLAYMREFTPNGRLIGELKFEWEEESRGFAQEKRWTNYFSSASLPHGHGWNADYHPRMLADINGDGRADIIGFGNHAVEVGISSGSETFIPSWWHRGIFTNDSGWLVDHHPRYVVDINGDGMADVVGFGHDGVYVGLSNGTNALSYPDRWTTDYAGNECLYGTSSLYTQHWNCWYYWRDVKRFPRHLADINGDGLPDIIGHGEEFTYIAMNNNGAKFDNFLPQKDPFSRPIFPANRMKFNDGSVSLVGDINGDGRKDIVVLEYSERNKGLEYAYTLHYALSHGDSLGNPVKTEIKTPYISKYLRHNVFLADVNGDGKDDFVFSGEDGLYVALSTGNTFAPPVPWTEHFCSYGSTHPTYQLFVTDVNGDGLADVVSINSYRVFVALSTGNGFAEPTDWTFGNSYWLSLPAYPSPRWLDNTGQNLHKNNFRTLADVNGDGLPDLVGFENNGVWVSLNQSTFPLLIAVRDTLGRQFTAEYDVLSNSAIYTKGSDPVAFPLMNFQGPLQVCKKLRTHTNDKSYFYEGAKIHQQGRGFLGFSKITEIDSVLELKQISEF